MLADSGILVGMLVHREAPVQRVLGLLLARLCTSRPGALVLGLDRGLGVRKTLSVVEMKFPEQIQITVGKGDQILVDRSDMRRLRLGRLARIEIILPR